MLAEVACVVHREVQLVVVRAHHIAPKIRWVAVRYYRRAEVHIVSEHRVVSVLSGDWCIQVASASGTLLQRVELERRTVFVALVCGNALRVAHRHGESLERLQPSPVIRDASVHGHVLAHVLHVVAVVVHHVVVVLAVARSGVRDSVCHDGVSVHVFRNVSRTCQQQVVVFLLVASAHLYVLLVVLSVVTAHGQVRLQPSRDFHVHSCTVVESVVVDVAQVTVLAEVAHSREVACLFCCSAYVEAVLLRESRLPVFVEQVVVQSLHRLELVSLVEVFGRVERREAGRVCRLHGVPQSSVVVCAQHLRCRHGVCQSELSVVADGRCSELSFLRCHEDYSVGGARSIHGCRCVLQHGDALHHRCVEVVECLFAQVMVCVSDFHVVGVDISVNYVERRLCRHSHVAQRVRVAYLYRCVVARTAVSSAYAHSVHESFEHACQSAAREVLQFVHVHGSHRTRQVCLLLCAVAHHYHFVEVLRVFLQLHFSSGSNSLRQIAYV